MTFFDNLNTLSGIKPGQEISLGEKNCLEVSQSNYFSKAVSYLGMANLVDSLDPKLWHQVAVDIETLSNQLLKEPANHLDLATGVLKGLVCWGASLQSGGFPKGAAKVKELCDLAAAQLQGVVAYHQLALSQGSAFLKLQSLDSDLEDYGGGGSNKDAALYLKEKIKLFQTFASWRLTDDQKQILDHLVQCLQRYQDISEAIDKQRRADLFGTEEEAERLQGKLKDISMSLVMGSLSALDEGAAWEIGLVLPGGWVTVSDHSYDVEGTYDTYRLSGHAAPIGLRLDKTGKVILTNCNVGAGSEGRVDESNQPGNTVLVPVEEYGPLSKKDAVVWLQKSLRLQKVWTCFSNGHGERLFKSLFDNLPELEVLHVLPRSAQNVSNCTLRNLNEWLVYSLQRVNEAGLASELIAFNRLPGANNNNENVESLTTEDGFTVIQSY